MALFRRFNVWTFDSMRDGVHNHSDHDFFVYLSNATITSTERNTLGLKSEIAEIAAGNGYAGPVDTLNTFSNVGKVYTMFGRSFLLTAAGGDIAEWRHILLYNEETLVKVDPLVCHWDHGNGIIIPNGSTHEILFGGAPVGQDGPILEIKSIV